jgi:AcrR family transcriptional regulator
MRYFGNDMSFSILGKGRRGMKPEYRRRQIMEVAKKVFAANGYHKANIEMICRKAGIGRGTVYRYFKNKEAIFAVILEENLEEMNRQMIDGYDFRGLFFESRDAMVQAYVDSVERILSFMFRDRDFARIALEVSTGVSKRFTQIRQEYDRKYISLIRTMMDQWKSNDFVRKDLDTELAAIRLTGAMEKIAWTFLFDQKMKFDKAQIRALAEKNAELDLNGMLVPETSAPVGAVPMSSQ